MVNVKNLKILYFGTPEISSYVLEELILNNYNVIAVVTNIDKPQGRKNILTPSSVKQIAIKYNIPCYQFKQLKNEFNWLFNINFDLIVTLSYGQIIPVELLKRAKYGAYNLHGSLLPKYRGASPIQTCLLNGDNITGITLMEMVEKMDAGKMYYKKEIKIEEDDNYSSLLDKLKPIAFSCFDEGISNVINKINLGEEQDESEVTFTRKIEKEDEIISFKDNATNIVNKVRALSLKPGAYFIYKNIKIKILKASVKEMGNSIENKIYEANKSELLIGTRSNLLNVITLQVEGKKVMNYKDFYNGNRSFFIKDDYIK